MLAVWSIASSACGPTPHVGIDDAAAAADADAAISTNQQWVLAYYVGYEINSYPVADIEWSPFTHIVFAPVTVNPDVTLDLSFDDSNGSGQADAMAVTSAAHAHGVTALLGLGGSGTGATIAIAASSANRAAFVQRLLDALDTLGFDGLDLDWEDHVNLDDLVALAQALRAARPRLVLTYPAHVINPNVDTMDPRLVTLAQSLDRFFVQTYYPSTAQPGDGWSSWFVGPISGATKSTPIAIDDSLGRYVAAGIPAAKVGMGTGFSAICYTGHVTGPRQPTTDATRILGGNNSYPLAAFFASGGTYDRAATSERRRDGVAQEPYLALAAATQDAHCGTATQYISYEDEASLAAKGAFSRAHGYGGIIIWTVAQGYLPDGAVDGRARDALFVALGDAFLR
jgi:chitinase